MAQAFSFWKNKTPAFFYYCTNQTAALQRICSSTNKWASYSSIRQILFISLKLNIRLFLFPRQPFETTTFFFFHINKTTDWKKPKKKRPTFDYEELITEIINKIIYTWVFSFYSFFSRSRANRLLLSLVSVSNPWMQELLGFLCLGALCPASHRAVSPRLCHPDTTLHLLTCCINHLWRGGW